MEKIIAEFGGGIKAFAVILAIALLVIGIAKSDTVKTSFENIVPGFMEQVQEQAGIELDGE